MSAPAILVRPLAAADHARWLELWTAYLAFYHTVLPVETSAATWARLFDEASPIHGLAAAGAAPLAIAHYVFHPTTWSVGDVCYLSDLFVDPAARGRGHARALIEAVAAAATARGCTRLYWLTHHENYPGRRLYDTLAKNLGFIEYERPLGRV